MGRHRAPGQRRERVPVTGGPGTGTVAPVCAPRTPSLASGPSQAPPSLSSACPPRPPPRLRTPEGDDGQPTEPSPNPVVPGPLTQAVDGAAGGPGGPPRRPRADGGWRGGARCHPGALRLAQGMWVLDGAGEAWARGGGGGEPEGLLHGDARGSAPDCGMATGSWGGRGPHRHRLLPSRPQTVCWSGPGAPRCLRRQARPCLWRGIPGGACREEGGSGSAAEWPSARAQVAGPLCDSNTLVLGCRPQGLPGGRSGSSLHRAALQGRLRTRPHKPALPSAPTEPPGCLVHGRPGVSQVSWGRGQGRLRQEAQAGGPW